MKIFLLSALTLTMAAESFAQTRPSRPSAPSRPSSDSRVSPAPGPGAGRTGNDSRTSPTPVPGRTGPDSRTSSTPGRDNDRHDNDRRDNDRHDNDRRDNDRHDNDRRDYSRHDNDRRDHGRFNSGYGYSTPGRGLPVPVPVPGYGYPGSYRPSYPSYPSRPIVRPHYRPNAYSRRDIRTVRISPIIWSLGFGYTCDAYDVLRLNYSVIHNFRFSSECRQAIEDIRLYGDFCDNENLYDRSGAHEAQFTYDYECRDALGWYY